MLGLFKTTLRLKQGNASDIRRRQSKKLTPLPGGLNSTAQSLMAPFKRSKANQKKRPRFNLDYLDGLQHAFANGLIIAPGLTTEPLQ